MYGVKTKEEFVRKRDAFDGLIKFSNARLTEKFHLKLTMKRVKSVLRKRLAKKSRIERGHSNSAVANGEKRCNLRPGNSTLFYSCQRILH
jgi:hypothetical protein